VSAQAAVWYVIIGSLCLLFGACLEDIPHERLACVGRWFAARAMARYENRQAYLAYLARQRAGIAALRASNCMCPVAGPCTACAGGLPCIYRRRHH
jgi:hypothetical protein